MIHGIWIVKVQFQSVLKRFSPQISYDIDDSQSANDDDSFSNIQNFPNQLRFEDEPANAELFSNFDSDVPECNVSIDQESLK